MAYTHTITSSLPWEEAVERTREALAQEGFGVLTEIDVRATFTKKLGQEAGDAVGDYIILGACNPQLAQHGIKAEPELGALLPCNVVVRRGPEDTATTIETIDPQTMVQVSDSDAIRDVANDADNRLKRALNNINGQSTGSF
ncbi:MULTISPECIES: DUF302 domain-containing protein [unclassified Arthrobacter]|uniref:DUF302 domain-containing protein n=1 Tax=unclassified Arthrobacter TaxID=235627 RepID=UPI00041D8A36|nr:MULTISPECIES: DUF302 domain-containing protein [unclassified Arthrobacter]MBE0010986.1 DUF302 domain-containing protein [Arthrobacter sp. AET 35A]PVE15145.1 DUF302 domain-containing protein [Arthrobacter sp. Bz4]